MVVNSTLNLDVGILNAFSTTILPTCYVSFWVLVWLVVVVVEVVAAVVHVEIECTIYVTQ